MTIFYLHLLIIPWIYQLFRNYHSQLTNFFSRFFSITSSLEITDFFQLNYSLVLSYQLSYKLLSKFIFLVINKLSSLYLLLNCALDFLTAMWNYEIYYNWIINFCPIKLSTKFRLSILTWVRYQQLFDYFSLTNFSIGWTINVVTILKSR